jgi:hypothetical protein
MTKHCSNTFGTCHSFLVLLFFTCLCSNGCKKSSSSGSTIVPVPSCGDTCLLTKYTWEIDTISTNCSAGTFTTDTGISQISWSTFTFNQNLSATDYDGNAFYSWTVSDQIALTFPPITSPIHFYVTVSPTSLALTTLKVQLHPQVDTSFEANGLVSNTLPGLHDQFQVDTSKLTYVQTTFHYAPKQ